MTRALFIVLAITALAACNGRAVVGGRADAAIAPTDAAAQADASSIDASADASRDAAAADGSADASPPADAASLTDASGPDASIDATVDSGPGATLCSTDEDCAFGSEWCEGGECVGCDNRGGDEGSLCGSVCARGRYRYTRNGCTPCECVIVNRCTSDADCAGLDPENPTCYAGGVCPDWCPPGDPSCCFGGNRCGVSGCEGSSYPAGCVATGCPYGSVCSTDTEFCTPSSCFCEPELGTFACTADCGGGVCISPL